MILPYDPATGSILADSLTLAVVSAEEDDLMRLYFDAGVLFGK